MKQQAFIYKVSGEIIPVLPSNGNDFTYQELTSFVNGHFDFERLEKSSIMVLNIEDILDLEINVEATKVYNALTGVTTVVYGDVVVSPERYVTLIIESKQSKDKRYE